MERLAVVTWNRKNKPVGYKILDEGVSFTLAPQEVYPVSNEYWKLNKVSVELNSRTSGTVEQMYTDERTKGTVYEDPDIPSHVKFYGFHGKEVNQKDLYIKQTFWDKVKRQRRQICIIEFIPKG